MLHDLYALLIDSGNVGVVVEADAGVYRLHDLLDGQGGSLVLAQHKDRGTGAGDAAAQGAGDPALCLYLVEAGDEHAADRLDDDVFEAAADEVLVLFHKAGHEAGDIAPLAD